MNFRANCLIGTMLSAASVLCSYSASLTSSALSHNVVMSCLTFYFELQYSSISCSPAGLAKGACWTVIHSVGSQ